MESKKSTVNFGAYFSLIDDALTTGLKSIQGISQFMKTVREEKVILTAGSVTLSKKIDMYCIILWKSDYVYVYAYIYVCV